MISLFPIPRSLALWPPLHCAIYERGEAAMFHCVHWFTLSIRGGEPVLKAQITFGVGSEFGSVCEKKRIEPMFG